MIHSDGKIKLTKGEKRIHAALPLGVTDPKTVAEYNEAHEASARLWEQGGSPEELLAAQLSRMQMVDVDAK